VIASARVELFDAVLKRLEKILYSNDFPDNPVDLYKQGYHDLVCPFEKWEPHPSRKAKDGRWRIVNCLSVTDQLVERVLLTPAVDAVKSAYPESGAVIGIGFTDEHVSNFANRVVSYPTPGYTDDVQGWERSLDDSYVKQASEMVASRLIEPEKHTRLLRAIGRHAFMITNPLFLVPTSDNSMFELVTRASSGGMLSGSYLTTLYNTLCRLDVAYLAGADRARASGDDCIDHSSKTRSELIASYAKLGYTLRDVEEVTRNRFSFCSHTMYRDSKGLWHASLDSWPKMLYKALTRPCTREREAAFHYELRNNENYTHLVEVLEEYARFVPDVDEPTNQDVLA